MRPDPAAVWRDLTTGLHGADAVWRELEDLHGSAGRHYHTLDHLAHFLAAMRAGEKHLTPDERQVFLWSVFFHDAIYDVLRKDSEARSADLATARMAALGLPTGTIARVREWILATAGHKPTRQPALDFFLDCDMSIFAAPADEYVAYTEAIRREYVGGGVSDEAFHQGRIAFLGGCLAREPFFLSPPFRALDGTARINIHDEIVRLAPDAAI